jgi:hypothetical protein
VSQPNPFDFTEPNPTRTRAEKPLYVRTKLKPASAPPDKDIGNALVSEFGKLLTPQGAGAAMSMMGGLAAVLLFMIYLDVSTELVPAEKLPAQERLAVLLLVGGGVATFVVGVGIWVLVAVKPSDDLKQRVAGMTDLIGRPRADVLAILGEPKQAEYGDVVALTWVTPHYTVAIGFRDDRSIGILREANL